MDFSKMKYNVDKAVSTDRLMIDVYPDLQDYEEFSDPINNDILIIMFSMVDEQSPFLKSYRDNFGLRLAKVYEYLDRNQDGISHEILSGRCKEFNSMTFRWFTLSDSLAYENWYSKSLNFHYMTSLLRQPPDFA